MCVHLNSLPDECLLAVFDRIPLSDLLRLDRVCHRWSSLHSSACARRRTLTLLLGGQRFDRSYFAIPFNEYLNISLAGGYSDLPVSERDASFTLPYLMPVTSFDEFLLNADESDGYFDILYRTFLGGPAEEELTELARLRTAHLSGHLVNSLAELFPTVSTLVVIHAKCYEAELRSLIHLLGLWSLKITKLWIRTCDIDEQFEHRPDHHPVHALLLTLNRQPSLQQLTLDIDHRPHHRWNNRRFTFPFVESFHFIGQLKVARLCLGWYDGSNALWDGLHRFGSTELRHIGLGSEAEDILLETGLNPEYEFVPKVRQLYSEWSFETVGELKQFCCRFASLTMLRIYWPSRINFANLVSNLASLLLLTHLKMYINFEVHPKNAFALPDRVGGGEGPRRVSLSQVKILELDIDNASSHQQFNSLSSLVFPSVELIILRNYECECEICEPYFNRRKNNQVAKRCHRLMILSLKDKFAHVRLYAKHVGYSSVFVDYSNYVRTVDDVLPPSRSKKLNRKRL